MPTLWLRAYGRTVALDGPASALTAAKERLPASYRNGSAPAERCWAIRGMSGLGWAATVEEEVLSFWESVVLATEAVLSDLELWIAECARNRVFVHAGCVAVERQAIVLPGRTMSGKSSLTAALVRAGADYYSDEYAVLDSRGLVRPYPRKLAVRPYSGAPVERIAVHELGGGIGRSPAKVQLVAALRFDPAAGWQIKPLTRAAIFLRLLDNTVAARSRPRAVLSALEEATRDTRNLEGTRGDADETAARLISILRR